MCKTPNELFPIPVKRKEHKYFCCACIATVKKMQKFCKKKKKPVSYVQHQTPEARQAISVKHIIILIITIVFILILIIFIMNTPIASTGACPRITTVAFVTQRWCWSIVNPGRRTHAPCSSLVGLNWSALVEKRVLLLQNRRHALPIEEQLQATLRSELCHNTLHLPSPLNLESLYLSAETLPQTLRFDHSTTRPHYRSERNLKIWDIDFCRKRTNDPSKFILPTEMSVTTHYLVYRISSVFDVNLQICHLKLSHIILVLIYDKFEYF